MFLLFREIYVTYIINLYDCIRPAQFLALALVMFSI